MKASSAVLSAQVNLVAEAMANDEVEDYVDELVDTLVALLEGDLELLAEVAIYFTHERPDLVPRGYTP